MNGVNYLLQTNLYLVLFIGFYTLLLRNETFFRQNRFYLNTSIFLSFVIPFMNSDWFRDLFITQKVRETAIIPSQVIYETIIVQADNKPSSWTIAELIFFVYATVAVLLLIRFIVHLILLSSKLKVEKGSAFSFFNNMVVDTTLPKAETIIDHEKVHIRQWHSADIIFIELVAIINWFNPVMYLYKKEIRHIHEFIADEETANLMESKSEYALLLFSNTLGVNPHELRNNFFNRSLLKRRIMMLHKTRSQRTGLWKYGFSAPLFALMLIVSAATAGSEDNVLNINSKKDISLLGSIAISEENKPESISLSGKINISADKPAKSIRQDAVQKPLDLAEGLKRHIQKNIKYPNSARNASITGHVLVRLKVSNNKIVKVSLEKRLQGDIDNDVLRTLSLYTDPINLKDADDYSLAIFYQHAGVESKGESFIDADKNNFLGHIVVTTMPGLTEQSILVSQSTDNVPTDFALVDVLPAFAGGLEGWRAYLSSNLKYPEEAKKNRVEGRVFVSFIVEKDGRLSDIQIRRGLGSGLNEEAIRVLKNSPNWEPGIQNGRPVRVAYTMPIYFKLYASPIEKKL